MLNWVYRVSAAAATHAHPLSTCHFCISSDFEDSTPPQSMWLRSGPLQLIWHWLMPRWHTGQSSHQKPKQPSGRSSYSYSSRDSCHLFGVEMVWSVFTSFREVLEVRLLKRSGSLACSKERTIRPVLRRFKDVSEAPKERTTMGQRPLKKSYLRVFQFRPLVVLLLGGSRTTPKLQGEDIPIRWFKVRWFFLMLLRRGKKSTY